MQNIFLLFLTVCTFSVFAQTTSAQKSPRLGYFIEVMSGLPLDEFFRTQIFDPLGMDDT